MVVHIQILFDNLDLATSGSLMRLNHRRRKVLHNWGGGGGGKVEDIGGGGGGGGKVENIGGGGGARGNKTFRWMLRW